MQVPGVDFVESLSLVASDTSTRIMIGLTLYHTKKGSIYELCDVEAEFLYPDMQVEIFIEWPGGIVDLTIVKKESLEEYCILLEKSMHGYVEAVLLWLRLIDKCLINV